jgi:hypothetical protein
MNWVIKLLHALRGRRKLKVSRREYEALLREERESARNAMPDTVTETLDPYGPSALKRESQNPLLGASYGMYLDKLEAGKIIDENTDSEGIS